MSSEHDFADAEANAPLYAAQFANGAYLAAPVISAYQIGTSDFTLEAWIQTAAPGGSGTVISDKVSAGGGTQDGGFLLVVRPDGTVKIATDNGFAFYQTISDATAVNDGTWHHVAAVRQGVNLQIYVDGVAVPCSPNGNGAPPISMVGTFPLTIATSQQQQEAYRDFTGQISLVAFWNVARSASQVQSDMESVLTGSESGLIGYWSFQSQDGADSSPQHNSAQPQGSVTYALPGPPIGGGDYAAVLSNNGYFSTPIENAYQFGTGDFTLEAWIKSATPGSGGAILSQKGTGGGGGNGGFIFNANPDGSMTLATDNGFGYFVGNAVPCGVSDGNWHFIAAVRSGASIQIYADGYPVQTSTAGNQPPPLNINGQQPLTIGHTLQSQQPYQYFTGSLDGVAVWNVARTAAQVFQDMKTVQTGSEAGLVGYWNFGYRNGLDSSPIGAYASPSGGVAYASPGAPYEYYALAIADSAYLQANANAAYRFGTGDFTVEAWVQVAQAGSDGTILSRKSSDGGPNYGGFLLVVEANGGLKFATDNGFGYFEIVTSPAHVNDGNWHFVAAVRQGSGFAVYVDGVLVPGQTGGNAAPPLDVNNDEPLTIGASLQAQEPDRFITGLLDGVAVWNEARTAAQIATDAGTRFTGDESGLVGYWSFDFRDSRDQSATRNPTAPVGTISYVPPGAPIGQQITIAPTLTQAAYDGAQVSATWTAVDQIPVTGYVLYLYQGQSVAGQAAFAGLTGAIPGALSGTDYTLRVQAVGAGVVGPFSDPLVVVSGPPVGVTVDVSDSIQVTWEAAPGATGYVATLSQNGVAVETASSTGLAATLAMPSDLTLAYVVEVVGQAGANNISVGPKSAPPVEAILNPPSMLVADYDGQILYLTWTAPTPSVSGYYVSVLDGDQEIAHATPAQPSAEIPIQLVDKATYTVRVRGTSASSAGPWSTSTPILPWPPKSIFAGTNGTAVAAQWGAVPLATQYEAQLCTAGTWGDGLSSPDPSVVFSPPFQANTTYAVKVRAAAVGTTGPWSSSVPGPFLTRRSLQYDGLGRITQIEATGLATETLTYDDLGNINARTVTLATQGDE